MSEASQRIDLRRLTVEGIVIVVSILLAFAVDALWDSHLERQRLAATMQQLREQLITDHEEIARAVEANGQTIDQLERFLTATPDDLLAMPMDSALHVASGLAASHNTYDQTGGVAASLPMSGVLALIDDAATRDALALWSSIPDEMAEDIAALAMADVELARASAGHGLRVALLSVTATDLSIPGSRPLSSILASMRADVATSDQVARKARFMTVYNRNLRGLQAFFAELGPLLEAY